MQIWTSMAGLLLLIYILVKSIDFVRRRDLPPGPRGLPVLGNLLLLRGKLPHHTLTQLGDEYGPLMFLQLGSFPTVVVSSPAMAEEFLKTKDQIFASRPPSLLGEIFFYHHQDVLTAPLGPVWSGFRKLCAVELFSPKSIASFSKSRKNAVLETLQIMLRDGREGKLVNLSKKASDITFDNITRMLFGKSYCGQKTKSINSQGKLKELDELSEELAQAIGTFSISDFVPWLRTLDIGGMEATFWNLRREFEDFINQVLDEHRDKDSRDVTATRDFTDVVLEIQRKGNGYGVSYSEDVVKAFLTALLAGGSDTSAATIVWMLSEILAHPDVKQILVEELDRVVGRERFVEEKDLENLPYFQATLRETFRLHPIAPLLIPHYSTQATKVAGYTIPKNSRVIVNFHRISRSPELWENPTEFDPTRFLNNPVDLKGTDYRLFPFSSGRRICPAANLAILYVSLSVAQILHTCNMSLPDGMEPQDIDFEESFGSAVHKKQHVQVQVSPRLPDHVYTAAGIDAS